jgi:quercetin dioxygenase-like cupin family protein
MINKQNFNDCPILPTPRGLDVRNLYDKEEAFINIITLQPGESLSRHITPVNVAFFVLEGNGIVEIGDEKQEVRPWTMVESPKNILHCWYNESNEILRFMVIKTPKPTTKTTFI